MRTEFTAEQLADPRLDEANSILRKCVHCGFCNSTCPTFKLIGDELDGPRGRIYLLKDMLEHDTTPSKQVVKHLDRCLSCLSCMTACPSGVNYMRLIDEGRSYIEKKFNRPLMERLFRNALALTLPYPGRFRLLLTLSGLLSPIKQLLPERFRAAMNLRSGVTRTGQKQRTGNGNNRLSPSPFSPESGRLSPSPLEGGNRKGAVGLIAGCVQQVMGTNINSASTRLLEQQGYQVHLLSDPVCCGAVERHLGKTAMSEKRFKQNIASWIKIVDALGLDALIVNASGCGTMMKEYGHLFRHDKALAADANRVSEMCRDISEFLSGQTMEFRSVEMNNIRVAYQSPCSMQHGQKIDSQPLNLLQQAGFNVQEFPEKYMCCGSAGVYNLLQPEIAHELGKRKAAHIEQANIDVIASGNLGCMMHMQQFTSIPIVHTVELLDWAASGPKPFQGDTRFPLDKRSNTL